MSNIVVNWLNSRTLCFRLNNSHSNRSSTIIFPLALTKSSLRIGWWVRGSRGQSNKNGCEQTLRSCITVFCNFILFTCFTENDSQIWANRMIERKAKNDSHVALYWYSLPISSTSSFPFLGLSSKSPRSRLSKYSSSSPSTSYLFLSFPLYLDFLGAFTSICFFFFSLN